MNNKITSEKEKKDYVLGLDLGTNSIGWAIVEYADDTPKKLIKTGVRIFQEAVDAKTRTPKNHARRDARGARRLLARYKMRRDSLLKHAIANDLLPKDSDARNELLMDINGNDPYQLRKRALDEKLSLHQIGRIFYHLNQRRGFKSNRKGKKDSEDGIVKGSISELRMSMQEVGARTLGEYLSMQERRRNRYPYHDRYTERAMYEEEFNLIWNTQKKFYSDILSDSLRVQIFRAIFFQRPLKIQKFLVGKCTFEKDKKRAPWAREITQRFRYLQDLSNLELRDPITRHYRKLNSEEHSRLAQRLELGDLSWSKVRQILNIHRGERLNLEDAKTKGLPGNRTAQKLIKALGDKFLKLTPQEKEDIVSDLLTIEAPEALLRRFREDWKFTDEESNALAEIQLEQGYARLSKKAIRKLVPHLQNGLRYNDAVTKAGYVFSESNEERANRFQLPLLDEPPQLRNPIVQKALYEARKVVNAIVKKYGKPTIIRIEMARDLKMGPRQLSEYKSELSKREKENNQVRDRLRSDFGITNPSRDDVEKFKLWEEMGCICPYTGKAISSDLLYSPAVQVEHIIPFSRCLDDSFMNKTVAFSSVNSQKGNKTPFEMYSGKEGEYLEVLGRIRNLHPAKVKRFEQAEVVVDDFIARQLNDTRYICKEVKDYLIRLGVTVQVSKGQLTAMLRRAWGVNNILGISEIKGKKERTDHRHHAIDAVIIALTAPKMLKVVSTISARRDDGAKGLRLALHEPWAGFRGTVVESINSLVVSHAARRKFADALHEDTAYGRIGDSNIFVTRKKLDANITENQIKGIMDPVVKELVIKRYNENGNNAKRAFGDLNNPLYHVDGKTPIRGVRIGVNMNPNGLLGVKNCKSNVYKYFPLGNNHHVTLFKKPDGTILPKFVSTLEATRRARLLKSPIFERQNESDWEFIFSLCPNDIVTVTNKTDTNKLYRVQKMSQSDNSFEITLRDIYSSTVEKGESFGELRVRSRPVLNNIKKVAVTILGDIYHAND